MRAGAARFATQADPQFADIVSGGGARREKTLEGTALVNPAFAGPDDRWIEDYVARLEVTDAGTVRYFRAAIATADTSGTLFVRDIAIAQIVAHLASFAGLLYADGSLHGPVDAAVAVTGIDGAASRDWKLSMFPPLGAFPTFHAAEFRNRLRTSTEQLFDDPCGVSRQLLARLLRVIRADGFRDPLAMKPR